MRIIPYEGELYDIVATLQIYYNSNAIVKYEEWILFTLSLWELFCNNWSDVKYGKKKNKTFPNER